MTVAGFRGRDAWRIDPFEKRLRRSQIFIARDARNGTSSVGATSNRGTSRYAAPNGAVRVCFTMAIKISLLRSRSSAWHGSRAAFHTPSALRSFIKRITRALSGAPTSRRAIMSRRFGANTRQPKTRRDANITMWRVHNCSFWTDGPKEAAAVAKSNTIYDDN